MKSFLPEHWLVMFTMAVVWVPLAAARVQISDDDHPNAQAVELECDNQRSSSRAGGLVGIAPDGLGATTKARECVTLSGKRRAAQIAPTIEVNDAAIGPESGPNMATADSASYALSLVNVRPDWAASKLTGENDGMSIFVRQGQGDAAALLTNVGVRHGFAATLESFTFSADQAGRPIRAVRTQLGVVNARDGGEFGLLLQAEHGADLSAGLRIASLGTATWKNYLEIVSPTGELVTAFRGADGAMVSGDLLPTKDLRKTVGSPTSRYAATYTQVLKLDPVLFGRLPPCADGQGEGTLAYVSDAAAAPTVWGQAITKGGGTNRIFVKCDGSRWAAF